MAYGILAGLTPSVGLYLAFFPTLIYFIFGTSRHVSTGTFAVISIMVSKIVNTYATINPSPIVSAASASAISAKNETIESQIPGEYTPFEVATAVTMAVGIMHIFMYIFRLGAFASLLSKPMVNAFTTAAAVHVLATQLKELFGVDVPRHKGAFKIILGLVDLIPKLPELNPVTVGVSLSTLIFMIFMTEFVKPKMAKVCKLPVPGELVAVVGTTIISRFFGFGETYGVRLVGEIPTGLPTPVAPSMGLVKIVAVDSIAIAIVSISIDISMALIFAQKNRYDIDPNQELLAFVSIF